MRDNSIRPRTPEELERTRRLFDDALDEFVARLQRDPTVVAAVLWGSLAYDVVWERSDIDVMIVRDDRKARAVGGFVPLTSYGVNIHAIVTTRADFRRTLQGATGGGFWHSLNSRGRMLFTRDESLQRIFDEVQTLGERDRRIRLLQAACMLLPGLDKTEKWIAVKQDADYARVWLASSLPSLGVIEVLLHKRVPGREALLEAMELNPEFFLTVYTKMLDGTTPVARALEAVYGYLEEHLQDIFGPLLDYLAEENAIRSVSDIEQHFERRMDVRMIAAACEWLAARDVLVKVSAPYFLTQHSRVELDQLAFCLPSDDR